MIVQFILASRMGKRELESDEEDDKPLKAKAAIAVPVEEKKVEAKKEEEKKVVENEACEKVRTGGRRN